MLILEFIIDFKLLNWNYLLQSSNFFIIIFAFACAVMGVIWFYFYFILHKNLYKNSKNLKKLKFWKFTKFSKKLKFIQKFQKFEKIEILKIY